MVFDFTIQSASMPNPVVHGTAEKNFRGIAEVRVHCPKSTLVLTDESLTEQFAIAAQIMEISTMKRGSSSAWDFSFNQARASYERQSGELARSLPDRVQSC